MSQSHCTLGFPLKTPSDTKALTDQLSPKVPALFATEDAIGTIHYSRFTVLSERTLLYRADFDGEFGPLMLDLARRAEPLFDAIKAPEGLVDPRRRTGICGLRTGWRSPYMRV